MEMPSYFSDFLRDVRPTDGQTKRMSEAHNELQTLLREDEALEAFLVTTFIQGSYRRHTALKAAHGNRCDVDVVAVTRFDKKMPPHEALDAFKPFLEEHYEGKYKPQGRSWGIDVDDVVKMDLVPTAAPSASMLRLFTQGGIGAWFEPKPTLLAESRRPQLDPILEAVRTMQAKDPKWLAEPLDIPDREARKWDQTHPLAQIEWTNVKNERTNGHYINIVKAVKWWRRSREPIPKYPRSYPLEHLLGENCPEGAVLKGVGSGIVLALESAVQRYAADVAAGRVPYLHDHGFAPHDRSHNVLGRVATADFKAFYDKMVKAARVARQALDSQSMHESSKLWRDLLGDEFPEAPPDSDNDDKGDGGKGGFSPRRDVSAISTARFA